MTKAIWFLQAALIALKLTGCITLTWTQVFVPACAMLVLDASLVVVAVLIASKRK